MRGWTWLIASACAVSVGWVAPGWGAPGHGVLAAPAAGVLAAPATSPSGADRQQARVHANAGFRAFKSGSYQTAIEQFAAAERLVHAPTHGLYMARSFAKLGRLVEAREHYIGLRDETLDSDAPAAFRSAQRSAADELAEVEARTPRIELVLEVPAGVEPLVRVDGAPLPSGAPAEPLWANPGRHELRAEAEGCAPATATLELTEGQGTVRVKLALTSLAVDEPPPPPPPPGDEPYELPLGPTVLTAAGIAVLAVGGITGGIALDRASELRDTCPQNPCPTANESLADEANLLASISTVSFIAGGLATAGGIAWFVADWLGTDETDASADGPETTGWRVRPVVGLGRVGVVGVLP